LVVVRNKLRCTGARALARVSTLLQAIAPGSIDSPDSPDPIEEAAC
jgi:hypothetical protein